MELTQAAAHLPGEMVVIDGKPVLSEAEGTVRRSHEAKAGKQAIHLVSAWASANTLTLGQVRTEETSNEITTLNKGQGRIERRECWAVDHPACLGYLGTAGDWPGLHSVVKVECRRETEAGATAQARYYISSLEASDTTL